MNPIRFDKEKFKDGFFTLRSKVAWAKDIVSILNVRKLIIYAIVIGLFIGYGYWKGVKEKPVHLDLKQKITVHLDKKKINAMEQPTIVKQEFETTFNYTDYINGKKHGVVKVDKIEELRKKYKPYGFTNKVIGVMGLGVSANDVSGESGVGYRYARLWKFRTEIVVTDKGFYPISVSYKPDWFFSNTSINVAGGKAWEDGSNRAFLGVNVEF